MKARTTTDPSWTAEFFISHTQADNPFCRQLVLPAIETISNRTFNKYVFMDYSNFGRGTEKDGPAVRRFAQAYAQEIDRILNESYRFVLVGSVAATQSEWVKREVTWWVDNHGLKGLLVVLREPCLLTTLHPVLQEGVATLHLTETADQNNTKLLAEALAVCLDS